MTDAPEHPPTRWVFLHGFTQTHQSWWPVIGSLARRWRSSDRDIPSLVLPDLPGHGLSDPPDSSLEGAAAGLLDAVGGDGCVVVGYSMGARYALASAAAEARQGRADPARIRGLILVGATAGIADPELRAERVAVDAGRADAIERDGVATFLDHWVQLDLFGGYRPTDLFYRRRNTAEGLAASLRRHGTGSQRPLWDDLASIDVPTLLVAGERDTKFVDLGQRISEELPHATFQTIADGDHAAHLQHPDRFAAIVIDWLNANPEIRPD